MSETPVVELVRVSTDAQAHEDRAGIPAQRTANRDTCGRFHLRVVESVEIVESGATVATSEGMARALDAMRSGRVQGVVLAAYDRLFRPDNWTDLRVLQVIADAGALVYLPSGPIDLRTEPGFIQASVSNMMAGLERRRIRERTMRAKDELRRAGRLASGKPPFGMAYSKAASWSYTDQIETVRAIYRAFLSGEERCYETLAERFALKVTQVRAILRRPVYAGWAVYPSREEPGKRDLRGWPAIFPWAPDGAIRAETGLPPAIALADFLEAQRIVEQRSERASLTRTSRTDAFLYRGMLNCSCGLPLYPTVKRYRNGEPSYFYACRSLRRGGEQCGARHMVRHRVEAGLDRVVSERLTDPDLIVAAVESYNDSLRAGWREVPQADGRRRKALLARRARVLEAFFDGVIDGAERDRQVGAVDAQLRALPVAPPAPPPALKVAQVRDVVRAFARWPRLRWAARREILEALAPSFVLHDYTIDGVHLSVLGRGDSRTATSKDTPSLYVPLGVAA